MHFAPTHYRYIPRIDENANEGQEDGSCGCLLRIEVLSVNYVPISFEQIIRRNR